MLRIVTKARLDALETLIASWRGRALDAEAETKPASSGIAVLADVASDHRAHAERLARRVWELERRLTATQKQLDDATGISDLDRPCGCSARFERHADGCPTLAKTAS